MTEICKLSNKPILENSSYCEDCIHDTDERESKLGCDIK